MSNLYEVDGDVVPQEDLKIPKAVDLARSIERMNYVSLVECRNIPNGYEVVVFDAEVERGQIVKNDIRRMERIAVEFEPDDMRIPKVFALRSDFPPVPHLNLEVEEFPRSLCLYANSYDEIKLHWTSMLFLERIREWLALTAKGELHQEGQPLEPFFLFSLGYLIVSSDLFGGNIDSQFLTVERREGVGKKLVLVAQPTKESDLDSGLKHIATIIRVDCQTHGVIHKTPTNLSELHNLLEGVGVNLVGILRDRFLKWKSEMQDFDEKVSPARLILIICIPKARTPGAEPETVDWCAFLCMESVKDIGIGIDIWNETDNGLGIVQASGRDENKKGEVIGIGLLDVAESFSRRMAKQLSNATEEKVKNIVSVGSGALGSQVFMNLIREGYGKWTLIDNDFLLPHNLARHALPAEAVGFPKAKCMSLVGTSVLGEEGCANFIVANVLHPNEFSAETEQALATADIILDMSASNEVPRYLAQDVVSKARRISIFLNPSGTGVVMLVEDAGRQVKLDMLEMQAYRAILETPPLRNYLLQPEGDIHYANSCSDVSSRMPQSLVALGASICSRAIPRTITDDEARIMIWHIDDEKLNTENYTVPVGKTVEIKIGEWTLQTDEALMEKIYEARATKLPNETGGTLVGSYDMQRRIVYVIDTVVSPPDSTEWPTVYIRGCRGLRQRHDKIQQMTSGQLDYVGEWHSHPEGHGCGPSNDDCNAFCWLSAHMDSEGKPALMLIAGDNSRYTFYLGDMKKG